MSWAGQTYLPKDNCDTKMESHLSDKGNSTSIPPVSKVVGHSEDANDMNITGDDSELQEDSIGRGKAFFIVNETGHSGFQTREGAKADLENLINVFCDKLKFTWVNKNSGYLDLEKEDFCSNHEILDKVCNCSCLICSIRSEDYTDCDSFVLGVSSHGATAENPSTRKTSTYFSLCDCYPVFVSDVLELIDDEHIPDLKDKPKIFIFHCCRLSHAESKDSRDEGFRCAAPDTTPDTAPPTPADTNDESGEDKSEDKSDPFALGNLTTTVPDVVGDGKDVLDVSYADTNDESGEDKSDPFALGNLTTTVPDVVGDGKDVLDVSYADTNDESGEDKSDPFALGNLTTTVPDVVGDGKDVLDVSYGPLHNDQFVVYAAPPGKLANYNTLTGSWMLAQLKAEMDECNLDEPLDFQQVITRVANAMSGLATNVWKRDKSNKVITDENGKRTLDEEKSNLKNVLCTSHTLTMPLVFKKVLPNPALTKSSPTIDDTYSKEKQMFAGKKKKRKGRPIDISD